MPLSVSKTHPVHVYANSLPPSPAPKKNPSSYEEPHYPQKHTGPLKRLNLPVT